MHLLLIPGLLFEVKDVIRRSTVSILIDILMSKMILEYYLIYSKLKGPYYDAYNFFNRTLVE